MTAVSTETRLPSWPGNHHARAPHTGRFVEGHRVVGRVRRDAGDVRVGRLHQIDARRGVVDRCLGQRLRDDDVRSVDTEVELFSATPAMSPMFRSGPLTFTDNRKSRAIDNEMEWSVAGRRWSSTSSC